MTPKGKKRAFRREDSQIDCSHSGAPYISPPILGIQVVLLVTHPGFVPTEVPGTWATLRQPPVRIGLPRAVGRLRWLVGPNVASTLELWRARHAGHSDDHLAHRFDATRSVTSPRWLKRRQNQGQLAGSRSDVQRRLRLQPLVCEQPLYSLCTSVTRIRAVLPRTRTGSVGVTSRWQTADGRCSERPFPAVAVACDVERPVTEEVYLLYVSVPELRCRGTRLRRSRGASGTRKKP